MTNAFQGFIKSAAVGVIGFVWLKFTKEAFKMAWIIIHSEDETWNPVVKCEECSCLYDENNLCWHCREGLLCDLKK